MEGGADLFGVRKCIPVQTLLRTAGKCNTNFVTIQPLQVYVNELKMSGLGSPHPWGEDLGGGLFVACRPPPRPSPRRVRVPLWYIVLNINKIQIIIGQSVVVPKNWTGV